MKPLKLQSSLSFNPRDVIDRNEVRKFLDDVAPLYPDFDTWFNFKAYRGLANGRKAIEVRVDGKLAGIAILKSTAAEAKICTLYVGENYRGMGIGSELISLSLKEFEGRSVLITVADERLSALSGVLKQYGFKLVKSAFEAYRAGVYEHYFIKE